MTKVLDKNQYNENGQKHGYWEVYWTIGILWYKGNYINGIRHGYWEEYYSDGKLWGKGNYIKGEYCGYWEFYCFDGEKKYEMYHL